MLVAVVLSAELQLFLCRIADMKVGSCSGIWIDTLQAATPNESAVADRSFCQRAADDLWSKTQQKTTS